MEHFSACNNLAKIENLAKYFYWTIDPPLGNLPSKSEHQKFSHRVIWNIFDIVYHVLYHLQSILYGLKSS